MEKGKSGEKEEKGIRKRENGGKKVIKGKNAKKGNEKWKN